MGELIAGLIEFVAQLLGSAYEFIMGKKDRK
jgi:hypothetical protein